MPPTQIEGDWAHVVTAGEGFVFGLGWAYWRWAVLPTASQHISWSANQAQTEDDCGFKGIARTI
jgi:hypothetical protein